MVVSWFAGLFYLPRIFVNLAMETHEVAYDRLLLMARKLYRFVTPIMWLTLATGIFSVQHELDVGEARVGCRSGRLSLCL